MASKDRVLAVLQAFKRGEMDAEDLENAVKDFLSAYADCRSDYLYGAKSRGALDALEILDRNASRVAKFVKSGIIDYPMCGDGTPMVCGRFYRRPDGSRGCLKEIRFDRTANPTLIFGDGETYRTGSRWFMPYTRIIEQNDASSKSV